MDRYEQALRQAGQMIFFGFDGYSVNRHALHAIQHTHLGNVILFARNYQNPGQFFALIRQLQHLAAQANGAPLFTAADQEGGCVTRMTSGVTWFPGPMATRAAAGQPQLAQQVGEAIGQEMACMGLNMALAPVADLADDPDSAHIGSRSYGAAPQACAPFLRAFIQGAQRHVIATAKHFPSIGGSRVDLHLALGQNSRSPAQLAAWEMAPVRAAVEAGVHAVMTSHEVYTGVENCPGTLSPILLGTFLRRQLGFRGLIISDCMEMQALCRRVPAPQACVRAVQAGVDLLLICHTEQVQDACAHALAQAICDGVIPRARVEEALGRIAAFKARLVLPTACPSPQADPLFARNRTLAQDICQRALTLSGDPELLRCRPDERFLLLAPPPAASTQADELNRAHGLCEAVQAAFPHAVCTEYPYPLAEEDLPRALAQLGRGPFEKILIATYNLHTDPGQQALLRAVQAAGPPVCAIALRTPYDARWYDTAAAQLFAYDYIPPAVHAIVRAMRGAQPCTGVLPADVQAVLLREKERSTGHVPTDDVLH